MASLTYLIYQENRRDKDGPIPCDERYRAVFSSFRKKSIVLESGKPERREPSVRSITSDPPKLRELIEESGILEELELGQEIDSTLAYDESKLDRNDLVRRPPSIRVDDKLRKVVDEVLKWDDDDSIHSMSGTGLGVHSKSAMSDYSSVMDQSQSTTPTRSNASSYKEIPYESTPQFNPENQIGYELEMNMRKSSPPSLESGQPPRPSLTMRPPGRLPSNIDTSRLKPAEKYKANVVNGCIGHRYDSISGQSCQTGVSEVTWQCEPNSPVRKFTLNPRAPQYQIAKEQEKERTMRTNNHSALARKSVKPPVRRPSPEVDSPDPPVRKQASPSHPRPVAAVTPESEEKVPLNDDIGLKGTIGGSAAAQPLPRKPQDSDPDQASGRVSQREDSVNENVATRQAALAFLIKPSAAKRRARAKPITPDHDQSARLFPHGIGYYGRKPLMIPAPPNRIPSPLAHPPRISLRHQLRPLLEPLGNDSSEDLSKLGSQSSRISLSEWTSDDEACQRKEASDATSETSIRVQLVPREITFHFEGQNRVHTGMYTGPINRYNRMHGNGVFWFNTGDVYLGQFSEGYLHGVGCMTIHMDDGSKQVLRGFFHKNEYVGTENIPDDFEDDILVD